MAIKLSWAKNEGRKKKRLTTKGLNYDLTIWSFDDLTFPVTSHQLCISSFFITCLFRQKEIAIKAN